MLGYANLPYLERINVAKPLITHRGLLMHAEGNNRQVFSQDQCPCFCGYCMSSQTGDLVHVYLLILNV